MTVPFDSAKHLHTKGEALSAGIVANFTGVGSENRMGC